MCVYARVGGGGRIRGGGGRGGGGGGRGGGGGGRGGGGDGKKGIRSLGAGDTDSCVPDVGCGN